MNSFEWISTTSDLIYDDTANKTLVVGGVEASISSEYYGLVYICRVDSFIGKVVASDGNCLYNVNATQEENASAYDVLVY